MSKIAFIYPGQGAQKCGMGRDFYENSEQAERYFDDVCGQLDFDLKKICFTENEEINQTEFTQPAMVAVCLMITQELLMRGIRPEMTAGLSLGEYAAIATAGAISMEDAVLLVRERGKLMQYTVPAGIGGMSAVLGMEAEKIEAVLQDIPGAVIANYNCPGQIVITGELTALEKAGAALKEAGAKRVLPLKVSGPFHSSLMEPAASKLKQELLKVTISDLQIPYISNVTAQKVTDKQEIAGLLCEGIHSSVHWEQSVRYMIRQGVDTFVEIGPGRTLAGFMKKIDPAVTVKNVAVWEDVEKVVNELC